MNAILDKFKGFLIRLCEGVCALGRRSSELEETFTFTVPVGIVEGTKEVRRLVQFEGRKLACHTYSQGNARVCETLYESSDRLLVHLRTLFRVEGLRTEYELQELSEPELRTEFPELYILRLPLTLEEALTDG